MPLEKVAHAIATSLSENKRLRSSTLGKFPKVDDEGVKSSGLSGMPRVVAMLREAAEAEGVVFLGDLALRPDHPIRIKARKRFVESIRRATRQPRRRRKVSEGRQTVQLTESRCTISGGMCSCRHCCAG